MSLLSLSKSLSSLFPEFKQLDLESYKFSNKFLAMLKSLSQNSQLSSAKTLKKIAYLCNYQFSKNDPSLLKFSENLLENHIKLCKTEKKPVKESIYRLLAITLLNESISHEKENLKKTMEYLIKASKIAEKIKFKTHKGKILRLVTKIKESEICILTNKFELAIQCAQDVLAQIQDKLETGNKNKAKTLAKIAINAFYKIAVCEESRGSRSAAEVALDNAEQIREKYLSDEPIIQDLNSELSQKLRELMKTSNFASNTIRKYTEKRLSRLRIPQDHSHEHLGRVFSDPSRDADPRFSKIPGRYYSNERLKALNDIISGKRSPVLMNTDKFFYNHITKHLKIDKDLTSHVDRISNNVKDHILAVTEAKNKLKNRRKIFKPMRREDAEVHKKIDKIEEEFDNHLKLQEIRVKSTMKTSVYKKLLKNININFSGNKTPPTQILSFKPPPVKRLSTVITILDEPKKPVESPKINTFNEFKIEIEDQLDEIYQDIYGKTSPGGNLRLYSPGTLATSTLKPKKMPRFSLDKKPKTPGPIVNSFFKTEVNIR